MPQGSGEPYAFGFERDADGALTFQCSKNVEAWPWLSLAPRHPIVIQTQQFWASFCALQFEGGLEEGQWSALTWMDYAIGDPDAGQAERGTYNRIESETGPAFALTLYDGEDRHIVSMRGRGVVFRNRNFEAWREGSKKAAKTERSTQPFAYATSGELGLGEGEFAFVGPLEKGAAQIEVLVTPENGMPPNNRMIGGSGDHVNTTHFGEVTRQALCLIIGDPKVVVTGGEMALKRYVELGTPFSLRVMSREDNAIRFEVTQLGKTCAEIALRW
ncbi:MAG: hypothetical protein AAF697_02800 [Pseudomonadota bacterium]